jgi:YesN/AraC family two-component response regulator
MSHYWLHFNLDLKTSNYLRLIKPLTAVKATEVDEMVFKLLIENIGNVSPSQKMACSGLATYLFSKFFAIDKIDFEKIRFFNVLKYIEEHLHETITNQQLADIMYLNPNYFSSLFVKKFGLSSKQYIIEQKLTLASKMLLESDKTVKQIAHDLGYNNETYFNKLFRSYTGVTPGKYRQTLQKK